MAAGATAAVTATAPSSSSSSSSSVRAALALVACAAGIYAAYITQGLVSERLQMARFGPERERFGNLEALNGAQAAVCFLWAYAILWLQRRAGGGKGSSGKGSSGSGKGAADVPAWHEYWKPALTNAIGPACGMVALRNISYPVRFESDSISNDGEQERGAQQRTALANNMHLKTTTMPATHPHTLENTHAHTK
jgi:UDP-galactose transporter B1